MNEALLVLLFAILAYYFIIFGKIAKSVVTLLIALVLMAIKVVEGLDLRNIGEVVDFNTLGLLLGMMIIVHILKGTGFFEYLAISAIKISRGRFWLLFAFLMVLTAVTSAFLDNLITIILISPILFLILDTMEVNPVPFFLFTIFIDNIGGMSTLIGSPLNIVLGSISGLSFNDFLKNMGPVTVLVFVIVFFLFKRYVHIDEKAFERLRNLLNVDPKRSITDPVVLKKSLFVFLSTLVLFGLHSLVEVELSLIALIAACALLLMLGKNFEEVSEGMDWDTLFFYTGLFIISYSLEQIGVMEVIASFLKALSFNRFLFVSTVTCISFFSTAFLSAVPATLIIAPTLKILISQGFPASLWWVYAFGANLGTNLTPLGAVQNIVGLSLLEKYTKHTVSFKEFFKVAWSFMFIPFIIAILYSLIIY
ncbi:MULTISPECIES: ArsB/NhaD family transporter [unclassified Thermotoga]|uniref:ArsB/NhaD family transporter n=1 Tax=unclassified Thermotoga TaxID=2631113 RepID=UPI000542EFE7|nr:MULTISPECIES: ArsB/NhaD family transporter [unclassified Thermotoga]KHC93165.1 citrate transporter [Thermotoga sp. TBGT1765]KHC94573.1 citrate transporter [Thermotoga sp. TBGT1766]KHC95984.1 citrate transporter [Thermotoga sp. Xyl54]